MLPTVIFLSVMTVSGLLFLLKRIMSWRLLLRLAVPIDIIFSIGMLMVGSGSLTGMAVAVTSAVLLSLVLWILKRSQWAAKAVNAKRVRWKLVKVED